MPSLEEEDSRPAEEIWTIPHSTVCRVVEALYLGRLYQRRSGNITERELVLMDRAIADLEEFSNHTKST